MTLGALVAAVPGNGFLADQVGILGRLAGPAVTAVFVYLVLVVGKLATDTLNAYGGFLTILTTVWGCTRRDLVSSVTRAALVGGFIAVSHLVALLASADFTALFENFILLLLTVFTPWSAINHVDYHLVSKERIDVPALYDPEGRYGRWNLMAFGVYLFGVLVQIPFLAQASSTGPVTEVLGGVDVSWIVGLVVTAGLHHPLAVRAHRRAQTGDHLRR